MEWKEYPLINQTELPPPPGEDFILMPVDRPDDESAQKQLLGWLNKAKDFAFALDRPRRRAMRENIALYQGFTYEDSRKIPDRRDWERMKAYGGHSNYILDRRIITNYIHEFIEAKVSQETSYKNIVSAYPTNSTEEKDIANAEAVNHLLKTIAFDNKLDSLKQEFCRQLHLCGDALWLCGWDPDKGPETKASKIAKVQKRFPLKNKDGSAVMDGSGKPKFYRKSIQIGALDFRILPGYDFSYEPVWNCQPRYVFIRSRENVDILRQKYPDAADSIAADPEGFYDYETGCRIRKGNQIEVFEFYYQADEFFPQGYWIKFVKGAVLKSRKLPYDHGKIPGVFQTDLNIPGVLRGFSFIRNTKPLQDSINNYRYLYRKLLKLAASPKIAYEEESLDEDDLDARPGFVPIARGASFQPYLLEAAKMPSFLPEVLQDELQELNRLNTIHPIAQGLPPSNAKSGEAFKVLSQQYNVRSNAFQIKLNQTDVDLARLQIETAKQYFPTSEDERLYKIFGEQDGDWLVEQWNNAAFETSLDVMMENKSALGDTDDARIQNTMMLFKEGFISKDSAKENFGMANFDRAYGDEVAAYQLARRENDLMMKGQFKKVPAPTLYQDHMSHYLTHYKAVQHSNFQNLPDWIRGDYRPGNPHFGRGTIGHLMVHVGLMVQEAQLEMQIGSTAKMQSYSALPGWTLFAQYFIQGGQAPGAEPLPTAEGAQAGVLPGNFQGVLPQATTELPTSTGQNFAPQVSGPMPGAPAPLPPPSAAGPTPVIDLMRQRSA